MGTWCLGIVKLQIPTVPVWPVIIKLKNVYSLRADGSVLFNYKRLFVVATKSK